MIPDKDMQINCMGDNIIKLQKKLTIVEGVLYLSCFVNGCLIAIVVLQYLKWF